MLIEQCLQLRDVFYFDGFDNISFRDLAQHLGTWLQIIIGNTFGFR